MNASKRKTSSESSQAKDPREISQAKDQKRQFPSERSQAKFPKQMILSERSQTEDANQDLKSSEGHAGIVCSGQLLRLSAEITCYDYMLRSAHCWNDLLRLSVGISG